MSEKLLSRVFAVLALMITVVWLVGYLAPIWKPNYTPPPELNIVMMAVVGVFVSLYTKARNPDDDDQNGDKDK